MKFRSGCSRSPFRGVTLLAFAAAIALAAMPRAAASADWPQAHSDLRGDPAVLFGTLPNGMRYAIMRNDTPKDAVSMWFVIRSGSLQENDAQQGLAHFLEHMAFRGSRHVPENEVWSGLQRLGITIGADANAETAFDVTKYLFNFPHSDEATIDTGLLRFRDIASELTLAQSAMDAERGPILSEERLRDGPGLRMFKQKLALVFAKDRLLSRYPIGLTDVLKHAPVSLIRSYYDAFYRPDRATLIVVGEIDPQSIQSKISKLFSDWAPTGPAASDPVRPAPGPRRAEAAYYAEAGAPSVLSLNWVLKTEPDTKARERQDLIKLMALKILDNRLKDFTSEDRHPITNTDIQPVREIPDAVVWAVDAAIRPQDWRVVLDAAIRETRRMQEFGISADEFARAKNEVLAVLQAAAAAARTRSSREVANGLSDSTTQNEVFVSPADSLELADEIFRTLTAEELSAAITAFMREHGPLVFLSTPEPIEGGKATLATALAADEKAPLTRATEEARVTWPYVSFGAPGEVGQVAERTLIPDLQVTSVRFANGVRLSVKPTAFKKGEIRVDVRIGNGRLDLPSDRDTVAWAVSDNGFVYGGLNAISYQDMQRALSDKVYKTEAGVADDGLMLWGSTRPSDLLTQLQVFAAFTSAPGWRPGAVEQASSTEIDKLQQSDTSPTEMFFRNLPCLLRSDDRRWCRPGLAELEHVKPEALKTLLAPTLAAAPIELTMAGDVTADDAIAAVAQTFGALPPRAAATSLKSAVVHFPDGHSAPIELHHNGRADQGIAALAWPTADAFDLKHVQRLSVLKSVMDTRILDELRIKDGATYSPFSFLNASKVAQGFGYLAVATELPPAKMPLFFSATDSITADLKRRPISQDELERARRPLLQDILTRRQTNNYWADALVGTQQDSRRLDIIRQTVPDLKLVTAEDVQRTANDYLSDSKVWKLKITATSRVASPK
jgi:zinc protease